MSCGQSGLCVTQPGWKCLEGLDGRGSSVMVRVIQELRVGRTGAVSLRTCRNMGAEGGSP